MDISDIIDHHAHDRPEHPAIEDGDRVISYADLADRIRIAAANLQGNTISAGDRVGVMLPDSAEHLIVLHALLKVGAVIVTIGLALPMIEKDRIVTQLGLKALIRSATASGVANVSNLLIEKICDQALANGRRFNRPAIDGEHPAMIIQSSGTTGNPKYFIRTHAGHLESMRRYAKYEGWMPEDRCLVIIGIGFQAGRNAYLGLLRLGATVVISHARSVEALVGDMVRKRISVVRLTPTHLQVLLDHAASASCLFPLLNVMAVGTAPITQEQRRLARARLTPNFIEWFGCNEAGLLAIATPADQDAYPDAAGRLVDEVETQVVDTNHNPLPIGQVGQIRFRGPGISSCYLDDVQATSRAFRNGWFYPGDLAVLNEHNYLFFKGRADDVINMSGVKFYPIEVENALKCHPQVLDAAVIAWPHPHYGQVPVAFVTCKMKTTAGALRDFCAQYIAPFKLPVAVVFLPELPRNALGKILKGNLREMFEKMTNGKS
jgi:acyl-CoA synthetase (AMP-forming)/AMP-acid ligase II